MNQQEYIQKILIEEIGDVAKNHAYLSFGLIASGIELLGICIDDKHKFFEPGHSGDRFREAINRLFPAKYKKYNHKNSEHDLYSELRCGLNHSTIPKPKIGLSESKHNQKHLSIRQDGILILVVEDFYADFVKACRKVIRLSKKGEVRNRFFLNLT